MKKFILIGSLLLSTTAFAGNNILSLSPGITTNNVMFGDAISIQVEKAHPTEKIMKGKPINKLETSDEFAIDDSSDGEISIDIVEVDHSDLEPRCACIGIDHIPFDDVRVDSPQE